MLLDASVTGKRTVGNTLEVEVRLSSLKINTNILVINLILDI